MHEGIIYENFKMNLISDDDAKREQAVILTQGFLKYVYSKYQILLNDGIFDAADEVKVYVHHPAKWNSYARTIMKQSVVSAGFCKEENIALKDEPTAAILAVIHERKADFQKYHWTQSSSPIMENQYKLRRFVPQLDDYYYTDGMYLSI